MKKRMTAFDKMYTDEEREIRIAEHAQRIQLFKDLKRKHPSLCKIPEEVYSIINKFIPDDFYERWVIARDIEDSKHHRLSREKRLERIEFEILDLLTNPNRPDGRKTA